MRVLREGYKSFLRKTGMISGKINDYNNDSKRENDFWIGYSFFSIYRNDGKYIFLFVMGEK